MNDMSDGIHDNTYQTGNHDQLYTSNDPGRDEWDNLGFETQQELPTISPVAKRVSEEKGIELDPVQYVAYEIICASFLLNLVEEK